MSSAAIVIDCCAIEVNQQHNNRVSIAGACWTLAHRHSEFDVEGASDEIKIIGGALRTGRRDAGDEER